MCGIAGYFGFEKNEGMLKRMNDAQAHRGPDGEGIFSENIVGLGHRRLAIIDRAHGQEPLFSHDKNLVISYNGEVYNYLELKSDLEQLGHVFDTSSDTEVIVQAYAEWGLQAFDKFNGMFAFALYDRKAKKLILARDHFGIKPLYFSNVGTDKEPKIVFASEVKAILASDEISAAANDRAIYRYLSFRIHDESEETFFKDVYKLLPGQYMELSTSGLKIGSYTKLPEVLAERGKEQRKYTKAEVKRYREMFTEAVKIRLQSEVPVGSCLSGGMDSSAVALTMNKLFVDKDVSAAPIGPTQYTFSAVFPNSINDEEKYVDAVVGRCKGDIKVIKVLPTAEDFHKDLSDFVRTQEEPTISTAQYAQFKVMQAAAKNVTVLLDGQGADEMLTGYYAYFLVYLRQLKSQKQFLKLSWEIITSADILWRAVRFRIKDMFSFRPGVNVNKLMQQGFNEKYQSETYYATPNKLRQRFIEDIFYNSLPALLRYEDRNSMRFSLEGRVPFLDKDVTEYLFSLSDDSIILNGWNKRIVRDALRDVLPPLVHKRRNKIGFTTPEVEWFRKLSTDFRKIFASESFASRPYFDQAKVLEAFDNFVDRKVAGDSMEFWRILNVELWLREYIDAPAD